MTDTDHTLEVLRKSLDELEPIEKRLKKMYYDARPSDPWFESLRAAHNRTKYAIVNIIAALDKVGTG